MGVGSTATVARPGGSSRGGAARRAWRRGPRGRRAGRAGVVLRVRGREQSGVTAGGERVEGGVRGGEIGARFPGGRLGGRAPPPPRTPGALGGVAQPVV